MLKIIIGIIIYLILECSELNYPCPDENVKLAVNDVTMTSYDPDTPPGNLIDGDLTTSTRILSGDGLEITATFLVLTEIRQLKIHGLTEGDVLTVSIFRDGSEVVKCGDLDGATGVMDCDGFGDQVSFRNNDLTDNIAITELEIFGPSGK